MNSSLMQNSRKQFKPDPNTLTVTVDEKEIGTVSFDLSKYYEAPKVEQIKAQMSGKRAIEDSSVLVLESESPTDFP